MKQTRSLLAGFALLSGAALLPLAGHSQSAAPAPSPTPSVSAPAAEGDGEATSIQGGDGHHGKRAEKWDALTPEERERVKAARQKALADPAVKAAEAEKATNHRAYRKAMHDAMLRADPTIGPVLEKLRPAGHGHEKLGADE